MPLKIWKLLRWLLLLCFLCPSATRQRPEVLQRPRLRVSRSSPGRVVLSAKQRATQARRNARRQWTLARLRAQYRVDELQRVAQKLQRNVEWRLEEDMPRRLEKVRYRVCFRSQALLDRLEEVRSWMASLGSFDGRIHINPRSWILASSGILQRFRINDGDGEWAASSWKRGAPSVAELANQAVKDVLSVSQADGWVEVAEGHGVMVWRKYLSMEDLGKPSKVGQPSALVPVVKARAVINASAEAVYELLQDNKRVHEYNDNCRVVMDMQKLDKDTKITWAASPRFGPFKPRDFCTLVHFRKTSDGLLIVANVPAEHKNAPLSPAFVRSEILLGGNIIRPLGPRKTELTMLTSIDTGDLPSAGAALVNKMAATTPISFIRRVEVAAQMDDEADGGAASEPKTNALRNAFRMSRKQNGLGGDTRPS